MTKKITLFGKLRADSNGCLSVAIPKDISVKMDRNAKYEITVTKIERFEAKYGRVVIIP